MRGAKERRDEAILERSTKRSLLLKNWRVPNPVKVTKNHKNMKTYQVQNAAVG